MIVPVTHAITASAKMASIAMTVFANLASQVRPSESVPTNLQSENQLSFEMSTNTL